MHSFFKYKRAYNIFHAYWNANISYKTFVVQALFRCFTCKFLFNLSNSAVVAVCRHSLCILLSITLYRFLILVNATRAFSIPIKMCFLSLFFREKLQSQTFQSVCGVHAAAARCCLFNRRLHRVFPVNFVYFSLRFWRNTISWASAHLFWWPSLK